MLQKDSRETPASMPDLSATEQTRLALHADIERLHNAAGCCALAETPALTALRQTLPPQLELNSRLDVLRSATGELGGGTRTEFAIALLGMDETRGFSKTAIYKTCADLPSPKYRSADSFRHAKTNGRNLIEVILEEVTDQLVALAERHGFHYALPPITSKVSADLSPQDQLIEWPREWGPPPATERELVMVTDDLPDDYYPHWNQLN